MKTTSRKYSSFAITVLFIIAIFTPLVGAFIQEDKSVSPAEKRKLAQFPSLPSDAEAFAQYPREVERYFNDQFGMREFFIQTYSRLKTFIGDSAISSSTNKVPTGNTVKGKDGWYFLNRVWDGDPISDYRNISLYSEVDLLRATLIYAARNDWLKRKGIRYLLFFAPNKHTIYSEYLPDYIVKQGDISSMDQLYNSLARYTSVEFVDLRDPLTEGKEKAPLYWKDHKDEAALYYKTDSHWNGAGADIVQYEVAKRIAKMFPGLITPEKRPIDDFVMFSSTGDISLIMGRDDLAAYGPTVFTAQCSTATPEEFKQRQQVTTCETGKLNALIFHDSFFTLPLKASFADYFARTAFVWESMSQQAVLAQLKKGKIDLVIEERAERFLPLIPDITSELYNDFWAYHFHQWKNSVVSIDAKLAATGSKRFSSHNLQLEAGTADEGSLIMHATTADPFLVMNSIPFKPGRLYMLQVEIDSPENTRLQVFVSSVDPAEKFPDQSRSASYPLRKGANVLYIPLFSGNLGDRLRFDPGSRSGLYRLNKFEIKEVDPSSLKRAS